MTAFKFILAFQGLNESDEVLPRCNNNANALSLLHWTYFL